MKKIYFTFPCSKVGFIVKTDSEEVLNFLNFFYHLEYYWDDRSTKNSIVYIEALLDKKKIQLVQDSKYIGALDHITDATTMFLNINSIVRSKLKFYDGWNPYHGAAVNVGEHTFLFLGHTKSGKSTLTAFLANQQDATIISEDIVLINYDTLEVKPYCRPIILREGGFNILKDKYGFQLENFVALDFSFERKYVCSVKPPSDDLTYYATCSFVLALKNTDVNVEKVSRNEKYLLHSYTHNTLPQNIKSSIKLDRTLPMYRLEYCDLREVYCFLKTYK